MSSAELGLNDHYYILLWNYDIKMETLNIPASATWSSFMRTINSVLLYLPSIQDVKLILHRWPQMANFGLKWAGPVKPQSKCLKLHKIQVVQTFL